MQLSRLAVGHPSGFLGLSANCCQARGHNWSRFLGVLPNPHSLRCVRACPSLQNPESEGLQVQGQLELHSMVQKKTKEGNKKKGKTKFGAFSNTAPNPPKDLPSPVGLMFNVMVSGSFLIPSQSTSAHSLSLRVHLLSQSVGNDLCVFAFVEHLPGPHHQTTGPKRAELSTSMTPTHS